MSAPVFIADFLFQHHMASIPTKIPTSRDSRIAIGRETARATFDEAGSAIILGMGYNTHSLVREGLGLFHADTLILF